MAKHQFNPHQLSLFFGQATLPATPISAEHAAIVHAHLPPPVLPPINPQEASTPKPSARKEAADATAAKKADPSELCWTSPNGTEGVPIPRPLQQAVAKGVFGTDEHDEPIDPSPDEVLAITLDHGERLTELFAAARRVDDLLTSRTRQDRKALLREREQTLSQAKMLVALYAEDFGEVAARHFESWAVRQLDSDAEDTSNAEPISPGEESPESSAVSAEPQPAAESPVRPKRRASTRSAKQDKIHEDVDRALDQLAESLAAGESETFKAWLTTMSRFHDYSLNNQMLIAFQRPDAIRVAGFHAWKKFNRLVSKGEKGIMILAPVTKPVAKVEETDKQGKTKEKTIRKMVNVKCVHVFDISQTHGEPLPEFAKVAGDATEYLTPMKEFIASNAIELYFADRLPGGAQGLSQGGRIGCLKGLSPAEEFRTLVHEAAHELLHRGERREQTTRRSRELEAESVAFVVCTTIGLDARQSSTDYIHLFRGNKQMLLESLQFIRQVSKEIISSLMPKDDSDAFSLARE